MSMAAEPDVAKLCEVAISSRAPLVMFKSDFLLTNASVTREVLAAAPVMSAATPPTVRAMTVPVAVFVESAVTLTG